MPSCKEIVEKLKGAKQSLKRRYGITDIALFGPSTKDEDCDDIDILITTDRALTIQFTDLEDELKELLQKDEDITMRKGIEADFYKSIKKELVYV